MLRCPHDTDNEGRGDLFEVCKLFKMYVSSNDSQNVKSPTAQFILRELDLNLKSHICLKFFWWNIKIFTLIQFLIFTCWDWHSGWVIYAKFPWLLWVPRRVRWPDSPFISTSVSVVSGFPVRRCTKCINLLLFKSLCCMCNLYIKHFEMYLCSTTLFTSRSARLPSSVQQGYCIFKVPTRTETWLCCKR